MLTKPTFATNNVQNLADLVQDQATAVKQTFDKASSDIKDYLEELCDEANEELATKEDLQSLVIGEFGTDFVTEAMMAAEMKKQAGGVAEYDTVATMSKNLSQITSIANIYAYKNIGGGL